jgi:hypothetical protein
VSITFSVCVAACQRSAAQRSASNVQHRFGAATARCHARTHPGRVLHGVALHVAHHGLHVVAVRLHQRAHDALQRASAKLSASPSGALGAGGSRAHQLHRGQPLGRALPLW